MWVRTRMRRARCPGLGKWIRQENRQTRRLLNERIAVQSLTTQGQSINGTSGFSRRAAGGSAQRRAGSVMNVLTSACFRSTVYPWGMERCEHGQGGNCLFHWPAARGEEANGKRYESVCPPRWWIRLKLEEEGFQSPHASTFPLFLQR